MSCSQADILRRPPFAICHWYSRRTYPQNQTKRTEQQSICHCPVLQQYVPAISAQLSRPPSGRAPQFRKKVPIFSQKFLNYC